MSHCESEPYNARVDHLSWEGPVQENVPESLRKINRSFQFLQANARTASSVAKALASRCYAIEDQHIAEWVGQIAQNVASRRACSCELFTESEIFSRPNRSNPTFSRFICFSRRGCCVRNMTSVTDRECQLAFPCGTNYSACGKRWISRLELRLLGRAAWRPRHRFLTTHKGDESVFHFPTSIFHPFSI